MTKLGHCLAPHWRTLTDIHGWYSVLSPPLPTSIWVNKHCIWIPNELTSPYCSLRGLQHGCILMLGLNVSWYGGIVYIVFAKNIQHCGWPCVVIPFVSVVVWVCTGLCFRLLDCTLYSVVLCVCGTETSVLRHYQGNIGCPEQCTLFFRSGLLYTWLEQEVSSLEMFPPF